MLLCACENIHVHVLLSLISHLNMYMYVQYNVHAHVALFPSIEFYKTKIKPEAMFYVELCSGEHIHVHNVYALKTGVYKCIYSVYMYMLIFSLVHVHVHVSWVRVPPEAVFSLPWVCCVALPCLFV